MLTETVNLDWVQGRQFLMRDPDPPWIYRKIHVHYKVSGGALVSGKVVKAITLAEEEYCGVFATLKQSDFEIIESKETA